MSVINPLAQCQDEATPVGGAAVSLPDQSMSVQSAAENTSQEILPNSSRWINTVEASAYGKGASGAERRTTLMRGIHKSYRRSTGQSRGVVGRAPKVAGCAPDPRRAFVCDGLPGLTNPAPRRGVQTHTSLTPKERVKLNSRANQQQRAVMMAVLADIVSGAGWSDEELQRRIAASMKGIQDVRGDLLNTQAIRVSQDGQSSGNTSSPSDDMFGDFDSNWY